MMKKFAILFILFAFFFSACKKDPDCNTQPPSPSYTFQDLVAYSYFKTGTYWIYKDSTSSIEDSVYVYTDTSYSYYQNNGIQMEGTYMFYTFQAHSFFDSYNYHYNISMGNYSVSTNEVGTVRIRTKPTDYVGETYLMSNRFVVGDMITWYLGTGSTYYKGFYDSLNILGNNYYSVVKFYDSQNLSEYESPTNFYIAKNIGIVRKEKLDSNKVWNLIRYNIVQ
jgi:hypothetical protein